MHFNLATDVSQVRNKHNILFCMLLQPWGLNDLYIYVHHTTSTQGFSPIPLINQFVASYVLKQPDIPSEFQAIKYELYMPARSMLNVIAGRSGCWWSLYLPLNRWRNRSNGLWLCVLPTLVCQKNSLKHISTISYYQVKWIQHKAGQGLNKIQKNWITFDQTRDPDYLHP